MAGVKNASQAERNRRICLLRRNGFTYSEIAQMEHISRPRVAQIVAEHNAELGEDDGRAEIATILEFAERKAVEVINDPGAMMAPNGRQATDEDGNPILNKGLMIEGIKTLVLVADKRSRLFGWDKPLQRTLTIEVGEAQRAAMADIARRKAELEALHRQVGRPVVPGQLLPVTQPETSSDEKG